MSMIQLENVEHSYSGSERAVHALRGISVEIDAGEFVAVTGPSGCGKSTLLNIIGTLDRPSSGRYLFQDQDVSKLGEGQLAKIRARQIGFVFQNFNLIDGLTVYANIELGLLYRHDGDKDHRELVLEAMDRVGIAHRAHHFPSQLSGGQQQRCAIARAIVGHPSLILADEPTGNLDSRSAAEIIGILKALHSDGATLIMVTHALSQADQASRVLEMLDGRVQISTRKMI